MVVFKMKERKFARAHACVSAAVISIDGMCDCSVQSGGGPATGNTQAGKRGGGGGGE